MQAMKTKIFDKVLLITGVALLAIFLLFSLFPSVFASYGAKEMFVPWQNPSFKHLLGTNDLGYDIFSELIFATRHSLLFGVLSALIASLVGALFGTIAGILDGFWGESLNGFIQVVLMIPLLPFAIAVTSLCGTSLLVEILIVGCLGWALVARVIRNQTIKLMQSDFIKALQALGTPRTRIIIFHLLPNLFEIIISRFITMVATFMLLEASMSFLGIGDIVNPTWGTMVNLAYRCGGFARGALNWLLPPCVCISLCVLSFWLLFTYFDRRSKRVQGIKT